MEKVSLQAKSSSSYEPYTVDFILKDGLLSIWCDCRAGRFGQLCKHKTALVSKDDTMLHDSTQIVDLHKVSEWVDSSSYPELIAELRESESQLESANSRLKSMKAKIARLMKEGTA